MRWPNTKTFLYIVGGFGAVEVLSWLAYTNPTTENIVTGLMVIAALWLAWKRPSWLALVSVAELVVGGKGYLFFLQVGGVSISIRILLYVLLVFRTLPYVIKEWPQLRRTVQAWPIRLLSLWLGVSVLIGLLRAHSASDVYRDANAFLFLALLPVWWIWLRRLENWQTTVLTVIVAGATMIGLKSWLMVLLFAHPSGHIHQVYMWIRNTGIGEITYIHDNVYRVFFQSHIYAVWGFIVALVAWIRWRGPHWVLIPLFFSALGVYVSLSRSLWLGLAAALAGLVAWLVWRRQWTSLVRLWLIIPVAVFAWAMMVWAISWPQFNVHGSGTAVASRLTGTGSQAAATARQNQIRPLFTAITSHPVIGSGFGQLVRYYSTDPTVYGWRTTAAFELGYLDLWLKIGLIGVGLYLWWLVGLWRRVMRTPWGMAMIFGGVALIVTNLTSPYLNHPLGLGWLMLTAIFAYGE